MSKEQRHPHFIICSLLFVICCLLFGCYDIFNNPQDAPPGYGRVAVTIIGAPARTVFPITAFAKYEYIFTKMIGEQPGEAETQEPVDGYFTLKFGDWQVTVNVYITNEDTVPAIYGTSATFNVSNEAISHIVIQLGTDAEGFGSFSYRITYPENVAIDTFKLGNLFNNDEIDIDISGSTEAGEGSVLVFTGSKENVPAGYYYLTIELLEAGVESRTAGASEVVYINNNLESEYSASFTTGDFSHIHEWEEWDPTDPATETDNGTETRECKRDRYGIHPETRTLYATGTLGLEFVPISPYNNTYRVNIGSAAGDVHIPAMHRLSADSPYLPVTEIGSFQGSSAPNIINIPASVTAISGNVFQGCNYLTEIKVDVNNQHYASDENGILYDKAKTLLIAVPGAKSGAVDIPEGVTSIGDSALYNCKLTSITLPASLTSIGDSAFFNCSGLSSITIPANVTSIGDSAFRYCGSITGIWVEGSNQYYSSDENGILYNKAKTRLIIAPGGIGGIITIPTSVSSIDNGAFYNCGSLNRITLLSGVTSIGDSTFYNCIGLTDITLPAGVRSIGNYAFSNCNSITDITIPSSVTSIGSFAFSNCTSLTTLTFPLQAGLTEIGDYAFSGSHVGNVTIPSGVRSIGSYAFSNCHNLNTISIPASVTSIGEGVLDNCSGLGSIMVDGGNPSYAAEGDILYDKAGTRIIAVAPDGIHGILEIPPTITSIGSRAFINCTGLTGINLPSTVTSIGSEAFSGCTSLTSIIIPSSVTSIGSQAFSNSGLTSITLQTSLTSIGDYAFYNCNSLTSITIPASVRSIGSYAFSSCTGLTGISIPAGVTSIGDGTFNNCTGLTGITLPTGVTSIGDSAFSNCSSLASLNIPTNVRSIGSYAFSNCTSITSISIPTGVTSIGLGAFSYWTGSQTINIQGHANRDAADTAWGSDWRNNCFATINYN